MSKIAPPREWGLPDSFASWRPVQEDALEFIGQSTKRVKALEIPTGGGKSLIAVAAALDPKVPTCYVTDSRGLQDQVFSTFSSLGMVDLRGRGNYTCPLRADFTCEDGFAAQCPHRGTHQCEASAAEMKAGSSWLVVTNYAKWIQTRKFGQGLGHIQRLILDEAHNGPDALARAMQVTLHSKEINETLKLDFPPEDEAEFFIAWKPWAIEARAKAYKMTKAAQEKVAGSKTPKSSWVRQFTHLRNLTRRLAILAAANVNNWVVEELPKGYQFDPVEPARYAESSLLLKVPDILCLSATMRPKTLYMMGIGRENFDYKEFPSDFDPKRCPIYYIPTMKVDAKAADLGMLWARLDQIAARRRDRNGIVHTVSYARRDDVLRNSQFASSMFINEKGEPPSWMIEQFVNAYPGGILVSPSVGQGFDFVGRQAEWQFICKIPFSPRTKIVQARTERDREYPFYMASQKLVQMVGRIMRSKDDMGESFLVDDNLQWFLPRFQHLTPKWFNGFFQQVDTLPPPPERLKS